MSPFKNYPTFETKIYKKTVKPSAQSKNAIALRNQKNLKHSDFWTLPININCC